MADRTTAMKLRRAATLADFDAIDQSDLPPHLHAHAKAWRARLERAEATTPSDAETDDER